MGRITIANEHGRYRRNHREISRYVRHVLRGERMPRWNVAVVFIDSRRSRRMNSRFLGHRYPTDVLSFTLETGVNPEGEIYVNLDRARQQARDYGVPFRTEIARLVIHGTLHLVGYDDRRAADAHRMRQREDRYVAALAPAGRSQGGS